MVFLNDVEEGGECAFPIADNRTFSWKVCLSKKIITSRNYDNTACRVILTKAKCNDVRIAALFKKRNQKNLYARSAPVVQKVNNALHWINLYLMDRD